MPKIVVFPADETGCGRYRLIWPAQVLRAQGHDVTIVWPSRRSGIGGAINEHGTAVQAYAPPGTDVVVLQRLSYRPIATAVPLLRAQGIAVVVDMDDDLSCIHPNNPAHRMYNPPPGLGSLHSWRHAADACRDATLVTTASEALQQVYAAHGRGIVLPNCVPQRYLEIERQDSDVIGWGGSIRSHPDDLQSVGVSVARLMREGHRFRVVGPRDGVKEALRLPHEPEATGSVPIEAWPNALATLGVGIAPLADTRFNASKCVDSSMRICTHRGVVEAAEIQPGDQVWRDGWKAVEAVEHDVPRPGIEITTEGGYKLRLTPEHRMLVNGEWTQAKDISVGDNMAMEPEPVGPTVPVRAPWPADSRMSRRGGPSDPKAFLTAPEGPRVELTPRWGRFLGAFVGDGNIGGSSTQIQISCDGQDQDWIDILMEDFRAFGFNPTTEVKTMFDGTVLRRRGVRVASAHLIRVLESWGLTKERPDGRPIRRVCVPEVIWRSPREVIAEFLAAYFEADGCTADSGVSAVSKDEQLTRDVQRLLLLFGIASRVRPRTHRAQNGFSGEYWHLTMGRAGADVFAKEIGFRSARKSARLAAITERPHSNAYRPMNWAPKVTEVKPCVVTPVDIQVEGSEYIAAGFVSHNSWLKPIEMSAVGVPWVASPRAEYKRFHALAPAGMLADSPRQWAARLRELATNEALRREMSQAGRALAARWTIEGNAWRWLDVWEQALQMQRRDHRSPTGGPVRPHIPAAAVARPGSSVDA